MLSWDLLGEGPRRGGVPIKGISFICGVGSTALIYFQTLVLFQHRGPLSPIKANLPGAPFPRDLMTYFSASRGRAPVADASLALPRYFCYFWLFAIFVILPYCVRYTKNFLFLLKFFVSSLVSGIISLKTCLFIGIFAGNKSLLAVNIG